MDEKLNWIHTQISIILHKLDFKTGQKKGYASSISNPVSDLLDVIFSFKLFVKSNIKFQN